MRDGNSVSFSREGLCERSEAVIQRNKRRSDVERIGVAVRVPPVGDGGDIVRGRRGDEFFVNLGFTVEDDQLGLAQSDKRDV